MIVSKKSGGDFQPHPETDGLVQGVIVDITPLKKRDTAYGPKEEFRLVIETECIKDEKDGTRWCVWSRGYTPSLSEKAAFRADLKKILGRPLTAAEEDGFDVEKQLLGYPVQLIVGHDISETDKTKTYANIRHIGPDRTGNPLKPSGKYVRVKDREQKGGAGTGTGASYRKAGGGNDEDGRADWQKCLVHIGAHKGVNLGDLDEEAVGKLLKNWLPLAKAAAKQTADDKRLIAALETVQGLLAGAPAGGADSPY